LRVSCMHSVFASTRRKRDARFPVNIVGDAGAACRNSHLTKTISVHLLTCTRIALLLQTLQPARADPLNAPEAQKSCAVIRTFHVEANQAVQRKVAVPNTIESSMYVAVERKYHCCIQRSAGQDTLCPTVPKPANALEIASSTRNDSSAAKASQGVASQQLPYVAHACPVACARQPCSSGQINDHDKDHWLFCAPQALVDLQRH
jgi:hypothetical protein